MKRTNKVRLTESQLHRVIKESVKKVIKEDYLDKSWESIIMSDGFWRHSPEQIHTYLLKRRYYIGMPTEQVMELIDWARGMFFLPLEIPQRDKDKVINIIMCRLKGIKFYTFYDGEKTEMFGDDVNNPSPNQHF